MMMSKKGSLVGAVLAIGIGILVLSIITVIFIGLQNAIIRDLKDYQFGDLIVTDETGLITKSESVLIGWFERNSDVIGVAPRLSGSADVEIRANGELIEEFGVPITGVDPLRDPTVSKLHATVVDGEFVFSSNSIVVGSSVSEDLGGVDVGDTLNLIITNRVDEDITEYFVVSGIAKTPGGNGLDSNIIMPIETLRDLLDRPGESGQMLVKLDDPESSEIIKELFLLSFANDDFEAQTIEEAGRDIIRNFSSALGMFTLIGYVGLMSSAFAIVTIQMMLVSSKTREVGILRAIGARRRDVLIVFLIQGLLIGLIGASVGSAFGIGFTAYAKESNLSFAGSLELEVEYDWGSIVSTASTAFVLAVIASIYPAYRATKLQPLEAMRGA
ncbi:FtsX-like permease family protein [archaeon]|nr:FtsX-like permease family protein [archaeon]